MFKSYILKTLAILSRFYSKYINLYDLNNLDQSFKQCKILDI